MATASQHIISGSASQTDTDVLEVWHKIIAPSCDTLRKLTGTTEDEFLRIGSQMQDFYQRSSEITTMANQLVESVSGELVESLISRLRQMMSDMEAYLSSERSHSQESSENLEQILALLEQVTLPLAGFQKMTKALRMLGISTKIESSRLGEMGNGFLTLALDVEKLSMQVSEKSSGILGHHKLMANMITDNLRIVRTSKSEHDRDVSGALASTSRNLENLIAVNSRCGNFGNLISAVSVEVSDNLSEVVSSMQMHDMTRQQFEHIIEALEHLSASLPNSSGPALDSENYRKLIIEAGDVCELQSAQLRFAASELCGAVRSIVENLLDVAGKQAQMAAETLSTAGMADSTGGTFVDAMNQGMSTVTAVLAKSAQSDRDMSATLSKVADTMQEVTGFVTDIENIGEEIELIALNSQVKAAHTGQEGAALGVLAEAIKRLSVDAVTRTESVSQILLQINQSTTHLFQEATEETEKLGARVEDIEAELSGILAGLGGINADLMGLLSGLNSRVSQLTDEIERATSNINVHERVARMADEVTASLDGIVAKARQLEPASTEFKVNLRHMEERYTMQSERHIHEAIARKRGGGAAHTIKMHSIETAGSVDNSEFGDNVDLF